MGSHPCHLKHYSTCPYTITQLYSTTNSSSYVIREHDEYSEYPHIYVKVLYRKERRQPIVIILSDTGTGLNLPNIEKTDRSEQTITAWNIASFLELTLNPSHNAPYIVLSTHCHYDHILGLKYLLEASADTTVYSSSYDISYLVPWHNLQKHSLCELKGLKAPSYDAHWIDDAQRIKYYDKSCNAFKESSIVVIHTPGHTPDSMSWYDYDSNTLCVGDMFYERESDETRSGSGGQWKQEPPQPVIFTEDSNITLWSAGMHRILDFVRAENRRLGTDTETDSHTSYQQSGFGERLNFDVEPLPDNDWLSIVPAKRRVVLCASHVTVAADAEVALLNMLAFMLRIQLDQVPRKRSGTDTWIWDDDSQTINETHGQTYEYRFSVRAPWCIIHQPN